MEKKNHITVKGWNTEFYLSNGKSCIEGKYPTAIKFDSEGKCISPAYLVFRKEFYSRHGNTLASVTICFEEEYDGQGFPLLKPNGMNAMQVKHFVRVYNKLFCHVAMEQAGTEKEVDR